MNITPHFNHASIFFILAVCLLSACQNSITYTKTKSEELIKIKIYHNKGEMLNDVIIHPTETHINVIHSNKTLTILVPKYIGISAEYFFFDNRERVLEFGMPFDPFKPMLKHPVKHIIITIIPAPPIEITAKDIVERFRKHKQKEQGN